MCLASSHLFFTPKICQLVYQEPQRTSAPLKGRSCHNRIFFSWLSVAERRKKKRSLAFAFQEIEFIFYLTGINNKQYFFFSFCCEGLCYVICLNIPLHFSNVNNDYSCASELSLLARALEVQETPGIVDRALNLNASHCDRASPNILGRVLVMLRQGLVALMLGTGFALIQS